MESVEELEVLLGKGLQKLGGAHEGQWTISVDEQHRICARFDEEAGKAYDVADGIDYH